MVRREVFVPLEGFDERLVSGSDREWLLRVSRRYAAELRARPRVHARKYVNLGYLHLRLDEPLLARQAFRRAVAIAPGFLPAYLRLALSFGGWRCWRRMSEARKMRSARAGW